MQGWVIGLPKIGLLDGCGIALCFLLILFGLFLLEKFAWPHLLLLLPKKQKKEKI